MGLVTVVEFIILKIFVNLVFVPKSLFAGITKYLKSI